MFKLFKKKKKYPLSAKKVRFSYGEKEILKDFNVNIKSSQILAVVGRSGEGKSTFLHLVVGVLTKKHEGKIQIHGMGKNLAKEDIGFVPQEISLVDDLCLEKNIEFFGNLNGLKEAQAKKEQKF